MVITRLADREVAVKQPMPCVTPSHPGSALEYQKPHLGRGLLAYSVTLPSSCCQFILRGTHCAYQMINSLTTLMKYVLKTSEKQASCSHLTAFTVKRRAIQNVVNTSSSAMTRPDLPCGNRSCYIAKTFFPL